MTKNNKELFVDFAGTVFTSFFQVDAAINALRKLGAAYGMDMDAVEAALRKSNAAEIAQGLREQDDTDMHVRIIGEAGFHVSQLASCVYDDSTGLDIVEPIGDALSFLIVMEKVEELANAESV